MPDVLMPRLSDSMEEGTIVRWLKAAGDEIARGEELVEIETDKATMTYEADDAGVLAIVAPEGATVPVGASIATIGAQSAQSVQSAQSAEAGEVAPARIASTTVAAAPPARRLSASPIARRIAQRLGVAIDTVVGKGPNGRILKADVLALANGGTREVQPALAATPAAETGRGVVAIVELSRLQQTVARRMSESKATVPDFAVEVTVDMTAALELRERLKQIADPAPSLNDLIIKVCGRTLPRHPRVNGAYRDGRFEQYGRVNVGMAVATETGLVVPTIHDADERSLSAIAADTRRLAERVRAGTVTPPELAAATFTVSNLGMFGVDRFVGVVNPPQAAILCVGAIGMRPAITDDGTVVARASATLTLVSDHRILYGADAARFLVDVRAGLEEPLGALV